ncbi:phosphotransferase [Paraburkholderia sp. 1N]|uniref:Phosphotransferase n=1 Tax=Paraburkholderia solitsugae TaxID=2675748 RepID=A0ABX2BME7_9BURK|nr:phosphotransferase [Paraburkholderia solitsugae]NPT40993.1 phosphotransferase [Paraburkholderia solitsugae]
MTDLIDSPCHDSLDSLRSAAMRALAHWGMACREIKLIKHRENAVFKVINEAGRAYALRVHRDGYHSDAALRSELQWMAALQQAGVDVPVVVPASNGDWFMRVAPEDGENALQIDLFEWLNGMQLGTSEGGLGQNVCDIERIYRTIGNIAARLHNQAQQWTPPAGFTRAAWDAAGLVGPAPLWGRFWALETLSLSQRALIVEARDIVRVQLAAMEEAPDHSDYYGLIHADFVPENLLVDQSVVRLLDFDDAGYGWHLFELATALYFIRDDPNYPIARAALIAGYREHRSLPDAILAKLPVFLMARGFTYLGWMHTRQGTETARELTPLVTRLACTLAEEFVAAHRAGHGLP